MADTQGSAPSRADLHIHSRYSPDSRLDPREIGRLAKARGLTALALTDHNSVDGHGPMRAACLEEGVLFIPGIEVTSAEGHILAYGVGKAPTSGKSAAETIEEVHALGGIASAAHPERVYTGLSVQVVRAARFDAVEAFNAQSAEGHNAQARKVAEELRLPVTGGSDAHFGDRISQGYLRMEAPPERADEAIEIILRGRNAAGGTRSGFGQVLRRSVATSYRWVLRGGRGI
ncbi:MAG TPA: CehA/McbA family metallohydrolase [Candidatus Thermoplasmatota archaeon]